MGVYVRRMLSRSSSFNFTHMIEPRSDVGVRTVFQAK